MKKIIMIILFFSIVIYPVFSFGTSNEDFDSIISSQKKSVNISKFITESQKYTEDVFKDTDIGEMLNSAISRKYR